jgi:predicted ATPase
MWLNFLSSLSTPLFQKIKVVKLKQLKWFTSSIGLSHIAISFYLPGVSSLKAIVLVFFVDIVKLYSLIILINPHAAFCRRN